MQPPVPFTPTQAQRHFLDHILGEPSYQSIPQICATAGISPSSYYAWCKDPAFRDWFVHEWSSALLFEGWHAIYLARAHQVRSPAHFKAIYDLTFDPKASAALATWQTHAVSGEPALPAAPQSPPALPSRPAASPNLQPVSPPNQSDSSKNWSFQQPASTSPANPAPPAGGAASPTPRAAGPSLRIRRLARSLQRAGAPIPGTRPRRHRTRPFASCCP
ncbi:MAG: hypothetical protein ACRD1L_07820, partial [Terriglobales bacterium]